VLIEVGIATLTRYFLDDCAEQYVTVVAVEPL